MVYLDTSAVLRVLLKQAGPLDLWGKWETAYSSEILGVEARMVIDRMRIRGELLDEDLARAHEDLARIEGAIGNIPVTRPVLRRASMPMPTSVRSLDASHLTAGPRLYLRLRRTRFGCWGAGLASTTCGAPSRRIRSTMPPTKVVTRANCCPPSSR